MRALRKLARGGAMMAAGITLAGALWLHGGVATAQAPVVDVGSLPVTQSTWHFDSNFQGNTLNWASVTITNSGSCFSGPDNPRPGTASAGLIIYYGTLAPVPGPLGVSVYSGNVEGTMGSAGVGTVRVSAPVTLNPVTHVDASLWNLEQWVEGNTLSVCLTPGN